MTRMSPSSKRMAARRAAAVKHLARSLPGRISGMPGMRKSRNSWDAAGMSAKEERDFVRFAMSAEEESYATQQNLSPVKRGEIKKTGGRLTCSKRPLG